MSLDISAKTIPQKKQRYETVGDWYQKGKKTYFRISDCGNRKYEWMLLIHEMVEMALCEAAQIHTKEVDNFDFNYKGKGEPGDDIKAPYRNQHCAATGIERMLCAAMGISWKVYDKFVSDLE